MSYQQLSPELITALLSTTQTEIADATAFDKLLEQYVCSGMDVRLAVQYAANNVQVEDLIQLGAMSHHSSEYAWNAPVSTEFDE